MEYTFKWLMKQYKANLIFMCTSRGIYNHDGMRKTQLTNLILEYEEENERLKAESLEVQRSVRIKRIYNKEN